ncbi:MAG TPA: selenocysteine-specific translation elongation factor [Pirellulaceae bacterium]|nr:selenocysteine-specific translation elongation factor [Pirellulaceae bacterium]HMO92999.1 selenocysteine-specific translation elongation factor [Pirellulaceae bacterium]HMP67923.1 selenocysteine-specific translation elongation factor [Pirellulaceae bacterium]
MHHLILGTAGHIDHGKTSLIRALTGIDTDRLPEEKKRGITIELGYAHLELEPYQFGIVDVPGHEKFVRQMLAGATGMDIVMLIIAADDSIKPQTIEHLQILNLLNVKHGVIVLTKIDTVEPDWLDLVSDDVRTFVEGTFLQEAPIVPVSSLTGAGIDELKQALRQVAQTVIEKRDSSETARPFRMAIDRVFTITGHGTIVTGSVASGHLSVGDQIEIQPGGIDVRVRGIQTHDHAVESISRGQRGAVNLVGVHHDELRRGQEIASKGFLHASRCMITQIQMLDADRLLLKDRQRIRFHIGTAETLAFVRLLSNENGVLLPRQLEPGEQGIAQVFLNEPVVAMWHQPFVIRTESPVATLGGGQVVHPDCSRINRRNQRQIENALLLGSQDPVQRVSAVLYLSDIGKWNRSHLITSSGVNEIDSILETLIERQDLVTIELSGNRKLQVHRLHLDDIADTIVAKLRSFHESNALASGMTLDQIKSHFAYLPHPEIVSTVLSRMVAGKLVERRSTVFGLPDKGPQLSKSELALMNDLVQQYRNAGLLTPAPKDLQQSVKKNRESVPAILDLLCNRGELVKVADDYYLHAETLAAVIRQLRQTWTQETGITTSEIRQELNISRKYAVPLCEYLDKIEVTRREGDLRYVLPY